MTCDSTRKVLRLALLIFTFLVSCAFLASLAWMLTRRANSYENYQLSRLNLSLARNGSEIESELTNVSQTLVKMEISIRRVEENSRRLKEYTRSLLWDNKDKSLWCILFKESEKKDDYAPRKNRVSVDEDYLDKLRKHRAKEEISWHVRHAGMHRHLRHKT